MISRKISALLKCDLFLCFMISNKEISQSKTCEPWEILTASHVNRGKKNKFAWEAWEKMRVNSVGVGRCEKICASKGV